MIDRREILERSGELSLRPDVVEKDHVLGWVLAGIAQHEEIGSSWIFKGGTCLKKVHFETYRFSEDPTSRSPRTRIWTKAFFGGCSARSRLGSMKRVVSRSPRISFASSRTATFGTASTQRVESTTGDHFNQAAACRESNSISRRMRSSCSNRRTSASPMDIATSRPVASGVRCYPFAEVFAEKIRALAQRG